MGLEMAHPYAKESDMVHAYNLSNMQLKQKDQSGFKASLGCVSFRLASETIVKTCLERRRRKRERDGKWSIFAFVLRAVCGS